MKTGRIGFGVVAALAVAVVIPVATADDQPVVAQAASQPNIVYIMTDDQDMVLMDYMPKTQALLADEGVTFENGLVDLPLCCPARATTLLGQGARKHGIYQNRHPGGYVPFVPYEDETIGVWMDRAGYDTAFIGKYINGYPSNVPQLKAVNHVPPGWDRWFGLWSNEQDAYGYEVNDDGVIKDGLGYNTDVMTDVAVDFIEQSDADPFFMMIFETAPHVPLQPAPRHADLYPDLSQPLSPNYDEVDISDKTYWGAEPRLTQAEIAAYDAEFRLRVLEMQSVDDMVEDVVTALASVGKLDDTYIVYTSDNGYLLGGHRLRGKVFPYEEAINVPLVVRGPGIAPGSTSDELVGNIDFAPTFAALGGAEVTIDVDGANFMGLVSSDVPTPPTWREVFRVNSAFFDVARAKDDVLIEFRTGGIEYYDLTVDPYQLVNTYATMDPVRLAELNSALTAFTADNVVPTVSAGVDRTISVTSLTLAGTVSDDGLPWATDLLTLPPSLEPLIVGWTQTSGPPGVVFDDPTSPTSTVSFPGKGVYRLELSADDSTGAITDAVTVFVRDFTLEVGFIAGSTNLASSDEAARNLMLSNGFVVTVIDDDTDFGVFDPSPFDVLVISSSVDPAKVGSALRTVPTPVLAWEHFLFDDMAFGGGQLTASTQSRVTIVDPDHALAADLVDSPVVYSPASKLSYGSVGPDAEIVATVQGEPDQVVIAAYSPGDLLTDGTEAVAARVLLFPDVVGPQRLNSNGAALFVSAMQWIGAQAGVAGVPEPPANQAPFVVAGPDRTTSDSVLTLDAAVDDDGLPIGAAVTSAWSQTAGPAGVTFDDNTVVDTTATFPGLGTYTLELTASDTELSASDAVTVTVRQAADNAVLISGNTSPPSGDRQIRDRMLAAGLDVTVIDDDIDLSMFDTSAVDLIVIGSSVTPSKVGDVFRTTPVPILTWENYLFDDLALASEGQSASTHTTITIADPTHSLAAGLTGSPTVHTSSNRLSWGTPGADADIVAHVPGHADQPVVIFYDTGDLLTDGTPAPAPRVALFPDYNGARNLSPDGVAIVDAAIALIAGDVGEPQPPTNQPPTVDAGPDQTVLLPDLSATIDATVTDDGLPTGAVVEVSWSQLSGPVGVTFAPGDEADTVATFPGAGTYVLQLFANDTTGNVSDMVNVVVREQGQDTLLVAGTGGPPSGDAQIQQRLVAAGLDVTVVDDDSDLAALDTTAFGLIVISSSVVPSKVGNVFAASSVPVLTWENYLFDDLGLATSSGSSATTTTLTISDPTHPLAAGLSGNRSVYTSSNRLSWGTPAASADVIAHAPGKPSQAVIISYETGDLLTTGLPAPGPRIAIFPDYNGARRLTPDGVALIDAAIALIAGDVGTPQPPSNRAPIVDAGPDRTVTLPELSVAIDGSVVDDELPEDAAVISEWTQLDGPAGVTFAPPDIANTTATFPGPGTYVLQLSADDSALSAADTVTVNVREAGQNVVMVAGSTSPPSGDRQIRDRLVAAGLDVTVVDDDADLAAFDTNDVDLIVIASSVVPSKVGNVFAQAPIPIITWENYLFDDLAMGSERVSSSTHTSITIIDPAHPLAAGLAGSPTVYTSANRLSWATPGAAADIVAHVPGASSQAVLFAYEQGALLTDGSFAPAARIGLFPDYNGARRLSTSGVAIVDAAIALVS